MKKSAIPIRSILPKQSGTDGFNSFRAFSISEMLSGKDMNQELHRHDFYFILVVSKGSGIHEIDFVEYPITDNSISIMRPGQVHRFKLKVGSEGYWLAFNREFQLLSSAKGKQLLRKVASQNFYKLDKTDIGALSVSLKSVLKEYTSKEDRFEDMIKANLNIFLIQLLRYQQNDQDASVKVNDYQQKKLQEFLDLLEVNIRTEKQAAAYADMMSLSPFQLNSITKSLLEKTATELINDQILLEAKRYLLGTSNQVTQIASQLGYQDISYFIRYFKKKMGVTPEVFRKNLR
jgi:AraC family transcriptional regulator, transcriptional activator of pobA